MVRRRTLFLAATLSLAGATVPVVGHAERTLQEYRYFRALSIDLQGRIPTRDEVARFEQPTFDVAQWVDERIGQPAYAERMRNLYMDLLRLEVTTAVQFNPQSIVLRRQQILGPDGTPEYVYYRATQRRTRAETDGDFCLTNAESGVTIDGSGGQRGTLRPVTRAALDAATVLVRPWWLYRDYRSATPTDRFNATTWATRFPNFSPIVALQREPDNMTQTMMVRVCREEASTGASGTVYFANRPRPATPPFGRVNNIPAETTYARTNAGMTIACSSDVAYRATADCGCGPGLERCMPGANSGVNPTAFMFPTRTPLGPDDPLDQVSQAQDDWNLFWWSQETQRFLEHMVSDDRDFREVLTARDTWINGPLASFYRHYAAASCCSTASQALGYVQPEGLFDPARVPTTLLPHDTTTWTRVADRGARASGLLTMPAFLMKYGSRRARAHVLYNAFTCRDFVAENVQLMPSTEPNLMVRSGCAACHATLEPLAAYFSRVAENDWTWLPATQFPVMNPMCAGATTAAMSGNCRSFYDPAFSTASMGMLRSAYGSPANADAGPAGAGRAITQSADFAPCAVTNVASAFLGRSLEAEDAPLARSLTTAFTTGNYRMRALVRAVVLSDAYRNANNLSSDAWRQGATTR
jgi:Protein of unknown function (DUF1585)/Protein of unknown function (DUF1549)/Protein of unknown function (DUF1592)